MKKLLNIFALLLFAAQVFAQSATKDSMMLAVSIDSALRKMEHQDDTLAIHTLLWLAEIHEGKDVTQAMHYLNSALRLGLKADKHVARIYNTIGMYYHNTGQYDSSIAYYHKARQASADDARQRSEAYQGLSINLLWHSLYDSAQYYLLEAKKIALSNKDYLDLAGICNSLGNVLLQQSKYEEALKQYIYTAKIQDSLLHDPVAQSRALVNIGNVQYLIGDLDKAISYTQEARVIAQKHDLKKHLAYIAQLMGRIYRKQKKTEEALAEYKKALEVYEQLGYVREASETYSNLGNIYFDVKDYKQARINYGKAIRIARKSANHHLLGVVYSALGFTYSQLKQYTVAIAYLDSAQTYAQISKDPYTVLDSYDALSTIYSEQQKYKEALFYYRAYAMLKDSLTEASSLSAIQELELNYQNEKKAGEIQLLKSNQSVQALTLSRQRLIIAAIAILLFSGLVISFLLISRYKVKSRTQRLLEIEKVRNTLARDLHDDIGSTLSSINILSQVALSEKNGNVQGYLQRIGDQSARIMEDLGDMVWSVNPHNDSIHQVLIHMREFASEILEPKNIAYRFKEEMQENTRLSAEQRKNLFLIFKESINNAAKYSQATEIDISLKQKDQRIILRIADNGKGFTVEQPASGNGLRNQRERAREINAVFLIASGEGRGTRVELQLPLTS